MLSGSLFFPSFFLLHRSRRILPVAAILANPWLEILADENGDIADQPQASRADDQHPVQSVVNAWLNEHFFGFAALAPKPLAVR